MSMKVEITVNGSPIRRVLIDNLTEQPTGTNTYRWTYARTDVPASEGLFSTQQGRIEHAMEDGAMALISKIAQAASETEVPAPMTDSPTQRPVIGTRKGHHERSRKRITEALQENGCGIFTANRLAEALLSLDGITMVDTAEVKRLRSYKSLPEGMVWQDYYSPDDVCKIREEYESADRNCRSSVAEPKE